MKTADFIREHNACHGGAKWALSISKNMSDVWDMMVKEGKHEWLIWTATRHGVFTESILRRLACRFVRETPIGGDRTVWDLLTDERSRKAVEVAEAYADGNATDGDLADARNAAYHAALTARDAARASTDAADAYYAAYYAANAAYNADAAYYAASSTACYAANAADAAYAAYAAASDAAWAALAADAAYADACAVARSAQVKMVAELGNPFKRSLDHENS